MLALDHTLTHGVVAGIDTADRWLEFTNTSSLSGVVLNPGHAAVAGVPSRKGIVIQAMGLPLLEGEPRNRVITASLRSAIALGCDAISLQLAFLRADLPDTIVTIGRLTASARALGIPVLLMISGDDTSEFELADKILIANQLGANLVKVGFDALPSGHARDRLKTAATWGAHVVLAGGPPSRAFEESLSCAAEAGFRGVCIGRHIFQAQDPLRVVDVIDRYFSP